MLIFVYWFIEVSECRANSYSKCQRDIYCGWCYSPEETGLGLCTHGGFSGPRDSCPALDWTWFYDEAPCKRIPTASTYL